jgi:hypothetical protein
VTDRTFARGVRTRRLAAAAATIGAALAAAPAAGAANVNYGPISHKGLESADG